MKLDRLGLIRQQQRGLTLVELMIASALAGIVTVGITMLISNVFATSARTSNHMTAVRQVQHAGKQVSQDVLMAQTVDTESHLLKLTWIDWGGPENVVVYSITEDSKLQRSHAVNDGVPTVTYVAQYIDPGETSCSWNATKLVFRVTANVRGQSETRVYEVKPRPDP